MVIRVNNIKCDVIIGGKDNLLGFNILTKMREYLRVKVEGASYSKQYKKRQWDGYKYFCTTKGSFATGFLPLVADYLTSLGVTITLEDERTSLPTFKKDFNNNINVWDVRDYQEEAIKAANNYLTIQDQTIYFPRGIYKAATNAGKNSIIASIQLNLEKPKGLMLLHNTTIYNQAIEFFTSVFGKVGKIDSKTFEIDDFTIAMYKSLYNKAQTSINVKKYLAELNTLYVDENHRAGSSDYAKLLTYINAGARYFFSGTPLDSTKKDHNLTIVGLSGNILYSVDNKFLIDNKFSAEPFVKIYLNDINKNYLDEFSYTEQYEEHIKFSLDRANLIRSGCLDNIDKQILISVEHKDHGEFLLEHLSKQLDKVDFVHGTDNLRKEKIEDFKNGVLRILISTMILKEGANIPNMDILFLAHGGKSVITVKQIVGRLLRMFGTDDKVLIVDFYDNGKWLAKHSRDRIRIYKKEQFNIEFKYNANALGFPQ